MFGIGALGSHAGSRGLMLESSALHNGVDADATSEGGSTSGARHCNSGGSPISSSDTLMSDLIYVRHVLSA